ncbi:hypothetical protein JOM56_004688 [Amanita muscaria]
MFDECKFFGYLTSGLITVLMDISEFGLQPPPPSPDGQAGPRFYMTYLEKVWYLLFAPGTRKCIMGYSDDFIRNYDNVDDAQCEKWVAEETAMAQAFDVTLVREVSRSMGVFVGITKKLGGWTAMTIESQLQYTQYAEAIMTLPSDHPAYHGLMKDVFRSFRG